MAIALTVAYFLVYLLAIQNLIVSPGTDFGRFVHLPSVQVAADWASKLFRQRAAFYYEPVAAIYPVNHVLLLVSPVNMAMGMLLGSLFGLNLATALYAVRRARACRTRAFAGLFGAVPGFLTGFACCVPSLALLLGAHFTLALIEVRSYFFPFALAALALSLVWNARRARRLPDHPRRAMAVDRAGV